MICNLKDMGIFILTYNKDNTINKGGKKVYES